MTYEEARAYSRRLHEEKDAKDAAHRKAALTSAIELHGIVSQIRSRWSNPKAPPLDAHCRIPEARVHEAVGRQVSRWTRPERAADMWPFSKDTDVLERITPHLLDDQLSTLKNPASNERLCSEFLDPLVAKLFDDVIGLPNGELLEAASTRALTRPSPAQYKASFAERMLTKADTLDPHVRRCADCGTPFAPRTRRAKFCSINCQTRPRNAKQRTKAPAGKAVDVVTKKVRSAEARLNKHWATCAKCKVGIACAVKETLLAEVMTRSDALSSHQTSGGDALERLHLPSDEPTDDQHEDEQSSSRIEATVTPKSPSFFRRIRAPRPDSTASSGGHNDDAKTGSSGTQKLGGSRRSR